MIYVNSLLSELWASGARRNMRCNVTAAVNILIVHQSRTIGNWKSCQILIILFSVCCHVFGVYPSSWFQHSVPLLALPWVPRGSHTEAGLGEHILGLPPRSASSQMCLWCSRRHHWGLSRGIIISRFPSVLQMSVCSVYEQQLAEAAHCSCFFFV